MGALVAGFLLWGNASHAAGARTPKAAAAASAREAAPPAVKPEYTIVDKIPAWVDPQTVDIQAPVPADQHTRGLHYLLVDRQVYLDGEDRQQYHHRVWKVLNDTGLEQAAHVEVGFDPSYQTLELHALRLWRKGQAQSRLHPQGIRILQREKSLEERIYDGTKTANLFVEDARVGDILELVYTLKGSNPVFKAWHSGGMDLQWGVPVQNVHARLVSANNRLPQWRMFNTELQPVREDRDGLRALVWRANGVQALRMMDDTPRGFDPYAQVQWSEYDDWDDVVSWALPLYTPPEIHGVELEAAVDQLRQWPGQAQRVAHALRLVQGQVRYLGVEVGAGSHAPTPPEIVWSRRFGDCKDKTLLTLTLLKALGIKANAALVNTKTRRAVQGYVPMPGAFDHVLVRVQLDDGAVYWLDPTLSMQEGRLDDFYQPDFGYALVIGPVVPLSHARGLTEMKPGAASEYRRDVVSLLDLRGPFDGAPSLTVTTVLQGRSAERMRETLMRSSAGDMQKDLTNFMARYYPTIEVQREFEVFDDKDNNQLTVTEHYRLPKFWDMETAGRVRSFVAAPDVHEYLRSPRDSVRTQPLAVAHPIKVQQTTLIQLPEQWSFRSGASTVKDAGFSFTGSTQFSSGLLTVVDQYESRADAIAVADMAAHIANLKKARNLLGASLDETLKKQP